MINQDDFSSDEHPNFFASEEYILPRTLFSRLFGILVTSATVERVLAKRTNGRAYATMLHLSVT